MTKTTFTIRSVSLMSKTFSNKDIFLIFSNDKFYWLSCWEDQQTKEPPGHCRWLDSPQRSFCFPFPPHWRQERVGGLVQEEIHLVDHLRSQWVQTWWHRCLWGWISCLESPGQKNFEKREVFPTLAEPNKSTMNSSDGQSPDFLNMEKIWIQMYEKYLELRSINQISFVSIETKMMRETWGTWEMPTCGWILYT